MFTFDYSSHQWQEGTKIKIKSIILHYIILKITKVHFYCLFSFYLRILTKNNTFNKTNFVIMKNILAIRLLNT